jgi:hypothetical protein|tara:strand:+ start:1784 stop:2488 length:705 start_codon:yes stop_codon:yes gene_type:complete
MAKRNNSKAPKTIKVVFFFGLLAALGGAVLGLFSLVTQPVTEMRAAPEEPDPSTVYYIKGADSGSSRWRTVRAQIFQGSAATLQVSAGDLNGWANAMFTPSKLKALPSDGEDTAQPPSSLFGLKVNLSSVNFRIEGDELQLAAYLEFPDLAPGKRFVYQALGSFEAGSEGPRFKARTSTLGRASLSAIPVVGGLIHQGLLSQLSSAPEWGALSGIWTNVAAIEIAEGMATLTLQ